MHPHIQRMRVLWSFFELVPRQAGHDARVRLSRGVVMGERPRIADEVGVEVGND